MKLAFSAAFIILCALGVALPAAGQPDSSAWGVLSNAMSGGDIWQADAREIAESLGMHPEMEDGRHRRHIVYPEQRWKGQEFRVLGREPRAILMIEGVADGKPKRIRVVFGNRGDDMWDIYKGKNPEDRPADISEAKRLHRKEMRDAVKSIDEDAVAISEKLIDMYGAAGRAKARRDIDTGESRKWWQAEGARIELAHSKGTITALDITPGKDQAPDAPAATSGTVASVRRDSNGDVFVDGVPEVHQGDKPYCSAASLERLLRLLSVDVDQYELGAAVGSGETQIGSGWRKLIDIAKGMARKHRITIGEVTARGEIDQVARHIDDGIPLMWCQRSTPALTNMLWELAKNRGELAPPSRKRRKALVEETTKTLGENHGVHACLVVGYNDTTEEVAISNTWQGKSDLLWIPLEVFEAADAKAPLFYLKRQ